MNLNTGEYWDNIWSNPITSDWRKYPECFKKVLDILGYNKKKSVLEVGCGNGILARQIRFYHNIQVCDVSKVAVENCKQKYNIEGKAFSVPPLIHDDDQFDYIVATELVEHVKHVDYLIEEFARVAKCAIIAVPNDVLGPDEEPEHFHKFNEISLEKLLKKHYKNVEIKQFVDRFKASENYNIALPTLFAHCY